MNIKYYDDLPKKLENDDIHLINLKHKKNIKSAIKRLSRWEHNQRKINKSKTFLIKCCVYYGINATIAEQLKNNIVKY